MKNQKPKTVGERQKKLRDSRRKWLKANGFKSAEGLVGALIRGEYIISKVKK